MIYPRRTVYQDFTAIETLKAFGINGLPNFPLLPVLIRSWMRDKNFPLQAVLALVRENSYIFCENFSRYVFGNLNSNEATSTVLQYMFKYIIASSNPESRLPVYEATHKENKFIDLAASYAYVGPGIKRGNASSTSFESYSTKVFEDLFSGIEVAVIGYGAAGILAVDLLRSLGITKITVFESSIGDGVRFGGGIWNQTNVNGQGRNNPNDLKHNAFSLDKAPGNGASVLQFLREIAAANRSYIRIVTTSVRKVIPGTGFNHKLAGSWTNDEYTGPYHIVINCAGIGKPRVFSNGPISSSHDIVPSYSHPYMTTSTKAVSSFGERWQRALTTSFCKRNMIIMIGLGNSTAELLSQIHNYQDEGLDVDYRIITHHSEQIIRNPDSYGDAMGSDGQLTHPRIFRDLSLPNLVSYQGDLPKSRYDYFRALLSKKIISGVTHFDRLGDHLNFYQYSTTNSIRFDKLFSLIGYATPKSEFEDFGLTLENGYPSIDYDGEVHSPTWKVGRTNSLYKGYYTFGALSRNNYDVNAMVIPGMLHRLSDLAMGLLIRAAEVKETV